MSTCQHPTGSSVLLSFLVLKFILIHLVGLRSLCVAYTVNLAENLIAP